MLKGHIVDQCTLGTKRGAYWRKQLFNIVVFRPMDASPMKVPITIASFALAIYDQHRLTVPSLL